MIHLIFLSVFTAAAVFLLTAASRKMFQMLQLSSYRAKGVLAWFKATKFDYAARYFAAAFLSGAGMAVYLACFSAFEWAYYFGTLIFILFGALFIVIDRKSEKQKTPLKVTKRVGRLMAVTFILNAALICGLLALGIPLSADFGDGFTGVYYAFTAVAFFLIPATVCLAHFILLPVEKLIQNGYKTKTAKALALKPNLIKIGITGSYGKTTAKNILAAMLSKKYKVLATPESYNTPMGICKTVNGSLTSETEVFIAEMGARYAGDIAELCRLVKPQYGIITGIGNQHLETFGSFENLYKTKYELIESLPESGHAFFNGECLGAVKMYGQCKIAKILTDGKSVQIATPLLGKHIPGQIALCAAVALQFGVSLAEIAEAARELKPVPHRLELIERDETTIIDDAYNANLDGAKNALEVLADFEGTRIVVTPGLVELGQEEEQANIDFGRAIAGAADYAILNSSRGAWIKKGCLEAGMEEERIILCASLDEAMEKVNAVPGKKVILFENDLPDNLE